MGWKITRDFLYESAEREHGKGNVPEWETNRKGKESISYTGADLYRVKTYDDDGTLYYEAVCDGEGSAELFHDWSMVDSGTVRSTIKAKGKKWGEFIS